MKREKIILLSLLLLVAGCSKRELVMTSRSMEPTIPAGSKVVVDFSAYDMEEIERSDLVCFIPEQYPDTVFVFRIAGLPEESITLDGSTIVINGHPTEIKGIEDSSAGILAKSVFLEADEYYVLGDNTEWAADSRYFGPIKRNQILGKVIKIQPSVSVNADKPHRLN